MAAARNNDRSGNADIISGIRTAVLGDVSNHPERARLVTWSSKVDRVDTSDSKARLRHLEVVRALGCTLLSGITRYCKLLHRYCNFRSNVITE